MSSNDPPQIIKQLPSSINKNLLDNSSNETIVNSTKTEYKEALQKDTRKFQLKIIYITRKQREETLYGSTYPLVGL